MKILVIDVETSSGVNEDGHPFDPRNRLYFIGCYDGSNVRIFDIEFGERPYGDKLRTVQSLIDSADLLVGFNIKFDLHWLKRYGVSFEHKPIWDLQYAEYCMSNQTWKMPDCDTACQRRGLEGKLPFDHSISHSEEEWIAYLHRDLVCEFALYERQKADLQNQTGLERLIWWGSQDIKNTEAMEYNGIKYDIEKSVAIGDQMLQDVAVYDSILYDFAPYPDFNWASPTHVSAILYGGKFVRKKAIRETYDYVYKSGKVVQKQRNVDQVIVFPRLVEPLPNTGIKKNSERSDPADHYFSTDEGILRRLKTVGQAKQIVDILLKRRALEKSVGTYYHGIPTLMEKMAWQENLIHGQLNHCVAATGRLASSKPNLQNMEAKMRQCIISRFEMPLVNSA